MDADKDLMSGDVLGLEEQFHVQVLWDFAKRQENDLELQAGDVVRVLRVVDEDWYLGETSDGERGFFPATYGAALTPEQLQEIDASEVAQGETAEAGLDEIGAPGPGGRAASTKSLIAPSEPEEDEGGAVAEVAEAKAAVPVDDDPNPIPEMVGRPTGEKELSKRMRIVDEIVMTEYTFARYVRAICRVCKKELAPPLVPADQQRAIFGNIEQIDQFAGIFLPELRRTAIAEDEMMGSTYLKYAPFFKMYSQYCGSHQRASMIVEELNDRVQLFRNKNKGSKRDRALAQAFDRITKHPSLNGQNMQSLLIMPVQRVPRHKLLLKELLKRTPTEHPDYEPCSKALEMISQSAMHVNEFIREAENTVKILEVEKSLVAPNGKKTQIMSLGVRFIREGTLRKLHPGTTTNSTEELMFFLFSAGTGDKAGAIFYGKTNIALKGLGIAYSGGQYLFRRKIKIKRVEDELTDEDIGYVHDQIEQEEELPDYSLPASGPPPPPPPLTGRRRPAGYSADQPFLQPAPPPPPKRPKSVSIDSEGSNAPPRPPLRMPGDRADTVAKGLGLPKDGSAAAASVSSRGIGGGASAGSNRILSAAAGAAATGNGEAVGAFATSLETEEEKDAAAAGAVKPLNHGSRDSIEGSTIDRPISARDAEFIRKRKATGFKIVGDKSIVVFAASEEEKRAWVDDIRKVANSAVDSDIEKRARAQAEKAAEDARLAAIEEAKKREQDAKYWKEKGEEFSGVKISAPVALRTVTAWYKLSGKKGARATKLVKGEIQLSFNVSKSGSDLAKQGPVNRLSLLYLSVTVLAARGIRAGDHKHNTSDAFCVLTCGNETHKTRVCKKSLDPVWLQQFQGLPFIAGFFSMVEVKVYHEHWLSPVLLGAVEVPLRTILSLVGIDVEALDASAEAVADVAERSASKAARKSLMVPSTFRLTLRREGGKDLKQLKPANEVLPLAHESIPEGQEGEGVNEAGKPPRLQRVLSKSSESSTMSREDVGKQGAQLLKRVMSGDHDFSTPPPPGML